MVISRPDASTRPLKSPFFIAGVGTVANSGAGVPSRYFFAGKQEERLVLEDRTVDAEPVLVDVLIGLGRAARIEEERIGRQGLAPHEIVGFAVEAVRP